jgi:hypothetical protein
MCTRVEYKVDYKGVSAASSIVDNIKDSISILDINYKINVDLTADFSTFDNTGVGIIYKNSPTILEIDVLAEVTVEAYLCGLDNVLVSDNTVKFTLGQDFRICVKPVVDDTYNYYVTGFESITCSNNGETRQLVVDGNTDVLTTIDDEPTGDGSLGFSSVVTSGFFTPEDNDFKCNGDVQLSVATTASQVVDDASDCATLCDVEGARGIPFPAGTSVAEFKTAVQAYIKGGNTPPLPPWKCNQLLERCCCH